MDVNTKDPIIGRVLGDFLVRTKLGEGGFGAVYKAIQITLSRPAVIKVLHTKHREDENVIKRFRREAFLASRLEHPYMAHIYSFGVEGDGLLWIAMEMVKGTPLSTWLKANGAMPLARLVPFFDKICQVVHTAHELGIVHRDIKPANIMVISRAGQLLPKLLDFGIAKDLSIKSKNTNENDQTDVLSKLTGLTLDSLEEDEDKVFTLKINETPSNSPLLANSQTPKNSFDTSAFTILKNSSLKVEEKSSKNDHSLEALTGKMLEEEFQDSSIKDQHTIADSTKNISSLETKGIVGSPKYMSPEQWTDSAKADARTDIYALGVTLYELLTKEFPFKGAGAILVSQHLTQPVPNLGEAFPEELNQVIAKAMAKDPNDRYRTTLEFAAALKEHSGFTQEQHNLPQLDSLLSSELLSDAPQPIAESIANLNSSRNVFQLRGNVLILFDVLIKYLGLLTLACHSSIKLSNKEQENVLISVKKIYSSGLTLEEWVNFIKELCLPFASQEHIYPIPEIIEIFVSNKNLLFSRNLALLLALEKERNSLVKEEQLAKDLEQDLANLSIILQATKFLNQYFLVIPNSFKDSQFINTAEKWMGAFKSNRSLITLKGKDFEFDKPVLTDTQGNVILKLWPLMQVAKPSDSQNKELFLLQQNGRNGARLISFPSGFEIESDWPWEWLKEQFFTLEERQQNSKLPESSPYLGLSQFSPKDSAIFFGREKETESFLNRLKVEPLLAIIGPSGAGKSSFIQAGIIANLSENWQSVTLRPGISPITTLSAKLTKLGIEIENLHLLLEKDPSSLAAKLRQFAKEQNKTLLIVVDQFEELLTLCLDKEEQKRYVEALVSFARSEEDPIRVILSMRDDFLVRAKELNAFKNRITQAIEILTTPTSTELFKILITPAKKLGYEFEDKELPTEIIESVTGQIGALPLLAFTASKLWESRDRQFKQLRRKTYQKMGGVGGALARHAEEMLEQMPQSKQELVKEAFRHLVTSEGTRAILTRQELVQLLGNNKDAEIVLEKLITNRLIVSTEGEKGFERIEIIHEALLSNWPRLVKWQQEAAEGARVLEQLRVAARQWQERGRPKGLLWRDEILAEYKLWKLHYKGNLTQVEEAFTNNSLSEASRNQRIKRVLLASLISLLTIVSLVMYSQKQATEQQLLRTLELYEEQGRQKLLEENLDGAAVYLSEAYAKGANSNSLRYMLAASLTGIENRLPITLVGHKDGVTMAVLSSDDSLIATSSKDNTAKIWQSNGGKELFTLNGHEAEVVSVEFSPNGKLLLTSSLDNTAKIWNVSDGTLIATLVGHSDWIQKAKFSLDGKSIVTISYDGTAKIWDSTTGHLIRTLSGHKAPIYAVSFSKDGELLATAGTDKLVNIWNNKGELKITLTGHKLSVTSIDFSPDSNLIVTGSTDKTAHIWQTADGKELHTLTHHQAGITDVKFSPNGKNILTTSVDSTACLWDTTTGALLQTLPSHKKDIIGGTFSPDGKLIITNSYDNSAKIWETATGKFLVPLLGHQASLNTGVFFSSGNKILTASEDNTAKIWILAREEKRPEQVSKIVDDNVNLCLKDGRLQAKNQATNKEEKSTEVEMPPQNQQPKNNFVYETETVEEIKIEMAKITGGTFNMGSPLTELDRERDETLHEVTVSSFYISKYEITQSQWRVVATLPKIKKTLTISPSDFKGDNLPVEKIDWDEAVEFCARLSKATGKKYRLPTEAEWEYAARAGNTGKYSGNLDDVAWYSLNSDRKTHAVGEKLPNAFGLYDVHGNVFEWCLDWFETYPKEKAKNPRADKSGTHRIVRGGCWFYPEQLCRFAYRMGNVPDTKREYVGFRVLRELD